MDTDEVRQRMLKLLSSREYVPQRRRGLAHALEIDDADYSEFRALLRAMKDEGAVVEGKGGKFRSPAASATPKAKEAPPAKHGRRSAQCLTGRFSLRRSGDGKVEVTGEDEGIFISRRDSGGALPGDVVAVELLRKPQQIGRRRVFFRGGGPQRHGRVLEILERSRTRWVGSFSAWEKRPGQTERRRLSGLFAPDSRAENAREFPVLAGNENGAKDGDRVVAELLPDASGRQGCETARVIEILGKAGELFAEIEAVCEEFGLRTDFPEAVKKEAAACATGALDAAGSAVFSTAEKKRRTDYTALLTITIDPTDAKDFDDAVSLRRTNDGEWELLVHIADVAHYVRPGSALDEEARRRSTSVYLPGRVLPMLPEQLSNNVCSLKPGVCRAVLTAAMVLGENRRPKRLRLQRSVIRSAARLNYDQVRDAVENEAADALDAERGPELLAALKEMRTLAGDMRRRRLEAGALDLDLPEIRPLLDERGKTVGWEKVEHHWAHQLIEEFMLAANGAVADQLVETDTTGLFRIHDEPDPAAMERFSEFLREFSLSFRRPYDRRELSRLLQKTRGAENGPMIHLALLTSLKQAVYAPVCRPHFALNASRYLHFTSPIRRYPDLIVHQSLHGRFTPAAAEAPRSAAGRLREAGDYEPLVGVTPDELQALAEHCSERERAAAEAEAQVVKLRQMDYMRRRQSDAWQGRIVRVLRTGFIVELEETGLSGFAAMRDLTDDYYEYIEPRHLLRGRRRGRCFRLGDKISVRILRLDSQRREVDLLPCSP